MHKQCRLISAFLAAALLGAALPASRARADGFDDEPFSLRFPAALSRFAPYGDVAATGGASAASKWSSSINPASADCIPLAGDLHMCLSPQYSNVDFANDTVLNVYAQALTMNLPQCGTVQVALAQVRSNEEPDRTGLDFQFDADLVQVQWGRRLDERWAAGAAFSFTRGHTQLDLPGPSVPVADSLSETYAWRAGALYDVTRRLRAGMVAEYAFTPSRTMVYDFLGLGVGNQHDHDMGHQFLARPGLAWEYLKDCVLYADYQYGAFMDGAGHLEVHRFYVGADQKIVEGVYVRGGATLDTRGNVAWTTGLGIYPSDRISVDIGFQDNMFPELEPDFGRSQTLTVSVSITF